MDEQNKMLMKQIIMNELMNKFNIIPIEAASMIENSAFSTMLEEDPEFIGHYSAEYWANNVYDEYH